MPIRENIHPRPDPVKSAGQYQSPRRNRGSGPLDRARPDPTAATAPPRSTPPPAITYATACPAPGTGRTAGSCTSWRPSSSATPPRFNYDRKVAAGKTPMEAMRALKRRLSDVVFRQMRTDARARAARSGPGGHSGAAPDSSAAGSNPDADSSDKSLPGPATSDPMPILPAIPPPQISAHAERE
jgi:hypothetical protein